ncbi:MAG: hypothetical protein H6738_08735 [Alphaproteobacteria bacterium]|nr:hypothetical protein [Alphaproteobacteria bacterium]MCB9696846.1 hypothetical protein [Alphaproteobacteria bacterium]
MSLVWALSAWAAPRAESTWVVGAGGGFGAPPTVQPWGGWLGVVSPVRAGRTVGPHLLAELEVVGLGRTESGRGIVESSARVWTGSARVGLAWFPWSRGGTWLRAAAGPGYAHRQSSHDLEVTLDEGWGLDVAAGAGQELMLGPTVALGAEGTVSTLFGPPIVPTLAATGLIRFYLR